MKRWCRCSAQPGIRHLSAKLTVAIVTCSWGRRWVCAIVGSENVDALYTVAHLNRSAVACLSALRSVSSGWTGAGGSWTGTRWRKKRTREWAQSSEKLGALGPGFVCGCPPSLTVFVLHGELPWEVAVGPIVSAL